MTTYANFVKALAKPGEDIIASITPEKAHMMHMAIGISGEAGELLIGCYTHDTKNVIEELGDLEFYIEGLGISAHAAVRDMLYDPAVAIMVHSAALLDVIKKHVIYNKDLDMHDAAGELAFIHHSMAEIREDFDITREQVLDANRAKLAKRYASLTYSDQAAHNRADKETK